MAKGYYKLRDTGTSFHDVTTNSGVVANRIGHLEITDRVRTAVRQRVLIEVPEDEGKAALAEQEKQLKETLEKNKKNKAVLSATAMGAAVTGDPNQNTKGEVQEPQTNTDSADGFKPDVILGGTVDEAKAQLTNLSEDELSTLLQAESEGKNRAGIKSAIEEQRAAIKPRKPNLGDI